MAGPSHLINWDFPLAPTPPPLAPAWFLAAAGFETPPGVSAHHANTPGKHPAPPTTALIRGCFGGVLARPQLQFGRSQGILDGLRWQLGLNIFTLHLSFLGHFLGFQIQIFARCWVSQEHMAKPHIGLVTRPTQRGFEVG